MIFFDYLIRHFWRLREVRPYDAHLEGNFLHPDWIEENET